MSLSLIDFLRTIRQKPQKLGDLTYTVVENKKSRFCDASHIRPDKPRAWIRCKQVYSGVAPRGMRAHKSVHLPMSLSAQFPSYLPPIAFPRSVLSSCLKKKDPHYYPLRPRKCEKSNSLCNSFFLSKCTIRGKWGEGQEGRLGLHSFQEV